MREGRSDSQQDAEDGTLGTSRAGLHPLHARFQEIVARLIRVPAEPAEVGQQCPSQDRLQQEQVAPSCN